MRDIVEDLQKALNDSRYMNAHHLLSNAANEIVRLRCELETVRRYPSLIIDTYPKPDPSLRFKVTYLTDQIPRLKYANFAKLNTNGDELD